MRVATLRGRFASVALLAAAAALLTESVLYRQNTLHHNGRWVSSKVPLARGVMMAATYVTTRNTLAGNRLNLGAWWGFQEVICKDPVVLGQLSGSVWMAPDGHVTILHHRDVNGFRGFRISRNPLFDSAYLEGTREGEFTAKRTLGALSIREGWNHFRVVVDGGRVSFRLNGKPIANESTLGPRPSRVGFRSGYSPVYVDDVDIRSNGGALHESFRNTRGYPGWFAGFLCGLVLVDLLAAAALRRRIRPVTAAALTNLLVAAGAGTFLLVDVYCLSPRYPGPFSMNRVVETTIAAGYRNTIEDERTMVQRVRRDYAERSDHERVVFLGTSQTWGAGAEYPAETFVARLEAMLNDHPVADGRGFETVNLALSGITSGRAVDIYAREGLRLRPTIAVANLSNNDYDETAFEKNLERLVTLNTAHGVRTLFVLEANTVEQAPSQEQPAARPKALSRNHAIMRAVAARFGVPVVDLDRRLAERHDTGFLWWDFVHLTSFGHRLAAEALLPTIAQMVARGPGSPKP